ncbi:MAG TPA: SAM-dependent methyltransferase, partial [Trebonia sp.]
AEMRRVTRGPVIILTCDPALVRDFWLYEYAPLVLDAEARRYPPVDRITAVLGGSSTVTPVPIPADCTDGFNEAYYARPEKLLDAGARLSCSAWSFVPSETAEEYVDRLRRDLADGTWDDRHRPLRAQREYEGSLVLIRSVPS